jgi:hypothetical protein
MSNFFFFIYTYHTDYVILVLISIIFYFEFHYKIAEKSTIKHKKYKERNSSCTRSSVDMVTGRTDERLGLVFLISHFDVKIRFDF